MSFRRLHPRSGALNPVELMALGYIMPTVDHTETDPWGETWTVGIDIGGYPVDVTMMCDDRQGFHTHGSELTDWLDGETAEMIEAMDYALMTTAVEYITALTIAAIRGEK